MPPLQSSKSASNSQESMIKLSNENSIEFKNELLTALQLINTRNFEVREKMQFKLDSQSVGSSLPLVTENFLSFKRAIKNKSRADQDIDMLAPEESEISLQTRKRETLLKSAAVKGGKLVHYDSRSIFEATILQLGPIAHKVNHLLRRCDIDQLKTLKIYQAQLHSQFKESVHLLYGI